LVNFRLSVIGKGIHIPKMWREHPVGSIQARKTIKKRLYRIQMQLRTMYLFSDTAAVNLRRGRVSGLGIFSGAMVGGGGVVEFTVVPLIIGTGGWNIYPEHYLASS